MIRPVSTFILALLLATPLAKAQDTPADILADPALDLNRPADRTKAVAKIKAIEDARAAKTRAKAKALGLKIRTEKPGGGVVEIVDFEGDRPVYIETKNLNAAISTGASLVQASPYGLDGTGIIAGVWDGGSVRSTHQEFANGSRVSIMDGAAGHNHATHVGGTIGAQGLYANAKGMATNVSIASYDWNSDTSEMTSRAATGPNQFDTKIYLSNHSYGSVNGWYSGQWVGNGTDQNAADYSFGQYSSMSNTVDALLYSAPYYAVFWAAGNDGSDNPSTGSTVLIGTSTVAYNPAIHPPGDGVYRNGFETIAAEGIAKNLITIGAANDAVTSGARDSSKATLTSFSSTGPTDDGRIKPDLVANGADLTSTVLASDTSYGGMSGTSMATPNSTGSAVLVVDQYKRLFNSAMRASTLKALLIHTATDIGNPGPDYKYGWGLLDVKKAVDLIRDHHANPVKTRITEDQLTTSTTTRSHSFLWDGSSPLRATVCWTDPAAASTTSHDSRTSRLVNNLNLKLIAPNGTEYFPYVMPFVGTWTTASMSQNATTGINNTDNTETVHIQSPGQTGTWQAVVSYTGALTNNTQAYGLILSGTANIPKPVEIAEVNGTSVVEGGATDTYTIALGSAPTANVTVSISPNAQVTTSASSVTFTKTNWSTPQTVTVTAVNDTTIEGSHTGLITHAATSSDPNFNGVSVVSVSVNITDNDDIVLTAPNGGESWMASSTQNITWTSLMGGNVKLELLKNGILDSVIIASTPNDGTHSWTIPTGQTPATNYKVRITSVETPASSDVSLANFTVSAIPVVIASQNFDASASFPADWSNTTASGTAAWTISTTKSHTPTRSAFVNGPAAVAQAYLTSAAMTIPSGMTDIQFSFYHDFNWESNFDGGLLEFSIDGGPWFDVNSSGSGASFSQNGYNLGSMNNQFGSPLAGRSVWTGSSGGFLQTIVNLTDTAKYAGKTLRVRWVSGSDNALSSAGWYVDTVQLQGLSPQGMLVSAGDLASTGNYGGPFTPASTVYTITNIGSSSVNWTAAKTASWLTLSSTGGTLAAGANATVTVSINSNANTLAATSHSDTVTFTNTSSGHGNTTRSVGLTIGKANQTITFEALADVFDNAAPFALTGTASSGLTVAYASSNTAVATVSGNTVTVVGAGSTTITASQAGNSNYNAATSVPQVLTVRRFNPLAVPGGPYKVLVGQTLALDGSASLPSGVSTISSYSWDLNNDGTFGDVTGANPAAIPFATLASTWGMIDGLNTIQLRVTDSAAKTSTVSTTVQLVYTLTWDANGTTAAQTNGGGAWLGANLWWDGAANQTWAPGSNAVFGGPSTAGGAVTLASPTSVNAINFDTFTGTYTLGTAAQTLTIGGGINKTAASAAVSISSPVVLSAAQTWTNLSSGGLTLASTLDNGGNLLTLDGTGPITMKAGTISGAGGLTTNGAGFSEIGGQNSAVAHSYTGTTTINGGVLRINGDVIAAGNLGSGNLTLNGGVLECYSNGTFTRTLGAGTGQVQLLGGASGFGSVNSVTFTLNNDAAFEPVWGSTYFNPGTLVLNASTSTGTATFANKLDLNGATRTIQVNAGTAVISGVIRTSTGTAGITKEGAGTLILNGVNAYTGNTTINGGVLRIGNNTAGTLASGAYAGNIAVAGGSTLAVWSSSSQILSGNISGNGNVQKAYGNTLTLSGNNTYTGKTSISPQNGTGGGLSVASFNSVNGGTPLLASSSLGCPTTVANGTVTIGNSAQQASCTLTYTGSGETTDRIIELQFNGTAKHTIYSSGSGLLKFTSPFAVVPGTGTTAGGLTLRGAGNGEIAGIAAAPGLLEKLDSGTWTISGATSFAGATTISGGTLALGANNVLSDTTAVSIGAATLNAATFTDTVGTLDVTGTANINLGSGGALAFADSSAIDWTGGTLYITGTFVSGSSLRFGTSNTGLTSTQLSKITGAGFSSFGLNASGYLIASSDSAPPTLASSNVVDNKGGGRIMVNTQVTYTVTFSEDMDATTVTSADFGNAGTSAVTIGTVTETAPGVFTVLATPTNAGTLILRVNAGAVLKDVGGNSLDTTAAIPDDTTVTVDGTAPTLATTGFVDDRAGARVMPNALVTYTVTFSEDMDASTVTAADFGNAGTSAVTIGTVTETTPGVFAVEATPTTVGTLQLRVNAGAVLKDVAGNNLNTGSAIADNTIITVETTLPTLAATGIVDNKSGAPVMPNTMVTYTVTFSEDMDATSVTAADFGNTGTAAVTIGTVTETTATSGIFTVQATPTSAGTLILSVNASAVLTDVAGNALDTSAPIADNTTITVEDILPTLAGANFVDNKSGAPIMANTLVTYTVTFSEDMDATTVSAADFGNAGTSTVTIGTVTETSPGVFTVPATPTNNGTLRLRVNAAAVLKDVAGNSLDTAAAIADDTAITVDGVAPTLASTAIVDDRGGSPLMPNTLVTYTVTFSEDMDASTVTAADFSNAGTSAVTIGTVTETAPGVFSVQTTPTNVGTLKLRVTAAAVLKDAVGNSLNTSSAIADDTTLTVETTAPTLTGTNIVDNRSGAPAMVNALVTYTVTFNEDMDATTVAADDFGNAGTAAVSIGTVTETTPGVFSVQATPTTAGTLILRVNAAAVLKDVAGNSLNTTAAIPDNTTITVDGVAPTLAATNFVDNKSGAAQAVNTLVTYTVTLSEDMDATTVTAADFGNAGTATVTIGTVTETTATSGIFTVQATPTSAGTLILKVNAGAMLKDVAGNSLDTTADIADNTTITVDGTAPTLASNAIVDNKGGSPVMPNTLVTYTVTFSKDMDATTVTAADFGNAGTSTVTIGTVTETTPGVFTVPATPTSVGTLILRVNQAAVLKDALGNSLNTTSAIADNTTITVENTVPTLAGTNIVDDKGGTPVMPNTLVTYTVTFSEDMDATTVTAADFGNAGTSAVTIGSVTESSPGVFSVLVTPTNAGTLILRVIAASVLKDVAGNSLNTTAAIPDNTTITVDATVPTLAGTNFVDDKGGASVAANSLVTYTVTFSEDMDASTVTAADFGNGGTSAVTIGTVSETSPGVFSVQVTPTSAGTLNLRVNAAAVLKDVAGNSLNTTSAIADNTTISVINSFASWSGGSASDADTNQDGVSNAVAWVLGANNVSTNARALLPTMDTTGDANYIIYSFRRSDAANTDPKTTITVEYGGNLTGWTTAAADGTNIIITPSDDFYGAGVDKVDVKIKRTLASGGRLFSRLKVVIAP